MLAVLGQPFDSDEHFFEFKWDGIRTEALVESGGVRLMSRNGIDISDRYPEMERTFRASPRAAPSTASSSRSGTESRTSRRSSGRATGRVPPRPRSWFSTSCTRATSPSWISPFPSGASAWSTWLAGRNAPACACRKGQPAAAFRCTSAPASRGWRVLSGSAYRVRTRRAGGTAPGSR